MNYADDIILLIVHTAGVVRELFMLVFQADTDNLTWTK